MKRDILASIFDWEKSRYRKPLILMGARQVGKTWLMTEFADQHYPKDTVYVNFMEKLGTDPAIVNKIKGLHGF